ncbi:MAG TPA: bifunctional phosphopantothenoylcysteine decarboxylase/phosphopantothenate--cysteine ligase CoaBC [Thermoanaerobaculia bacterium]|nr:bifunctional phosphopantothenoylcysteine decarboxylase/phosphopantothenate--cysteine ligase CoaBC [Thermoanaerobaculia bacterium]
MNVLAGKRIVLGVGGSIAAYKAADLASRLTQEGALVDAVLTAAGARFVSPLAFRSVTGRPAFADLWSEEAHVLHVSLGHEADLLLVAPATADLIAKLAHGLADDLLTVTALAVKAPLVLCPAMDAGMWEHPATRANVETLKGRGAIFVGPAEGRMASGLSGTGRFAEPEEIVGRVRTVLGKNGPLAGRAVVVSAGPTFEPIDPVRFVGNRSSGRQGFAMARAALDLGARVVLVAGPTPLATPAGAERIDVATAAEMRDAVLTASARADALVMAAAVADFRPEEPARAKLKKGGAKSLTLRLAPTADVLAEAGARRKKTGKPRVLVGFAAETGDPVAEARRKLLAKGLDLVVANDVTAPDAGFGASTNRVVLVEGKGETPFPLMGKDEVAALVMERVAALLGSDAPKKSPRRGR